MTNEQLMQKMKEDMEMRGFSKYTKYSYTHQAKYTMEYFKKPMEEVSTQELREYLLKHLKEEKKLSERSVNYYNSVIRFMFEVTLDKVINRKQLPMYRKSKPLPKILTKEELVSFFNVCNYKYKTIFMLVYGSGLRISEVANLEIEDIDAERMRILVRNGKGKKERYTILPELSLKMLREYWTRYRKSKRKGKIFLSESGEAVTVGVIREHFRKYRRKAKLNENFTVHSLRHRFCNRLNRKRSNNNTSKRIIGT